MQNLQGSIGIKDSFTPALESMATAMEGLLNLTQAVGAETETAFEADKVVEIRGAIDDMKGAMEGLKAPTEKALPEPLKEANKEGNKLIDVVKRIGLAIASVKAIKLFVDQADTMNSIYARMNLINDGLSTTDELMDSVYKSAQRSRGAFKDTADFVAKLGGSTEGVFANNEELISFAETLNKQFALSGTTQAEQASAMLQLTQAMGSGVLRGEEFNAVLEASPGVIKLIANEMGVTVGQMRDLAAEGQITSDVVKNALINASDEVNQKFESMPMTMEQVATNAKNRIQKAFMPLFNMFERAINSEVFMAVMEKIFSGIEKLVYGLQVVGAVTGKVVGWIYDNWSTLEPLFVAVAGAILFYLGLIAVKSIATAVTMIASFVAANAPILAVGAVLALVIYQLIKMGITAGDIVGFMVGLVYGLWAIIQNIIALLVNMVLSTAEVLINRFIAIYNVAKTVVNAVKNVFKHGFGAIQAGVLSILNSIISGLENMVNSAIRGLNRLVEFANKIPRVNISTVGEVELSRFNVDTSNFDPVELEDSVDFSKYELKYKDIGQSFQAGKDAGKNFTNNLTDKVKSLTDGLGEKLDFGDVPALDDMKESLDGIDRATGGTGDSVKGNTKKSADLKEKELKEMKRTNTNLDYMRDLAERRAITNVTWDKLDVKVSNSFGDVNQTADLDGWINNLAEVLEEEISNGVPGRGYA